MRKWNYAITTDKFTLAQKNLTSSKAEITKANEISCVSNSFDSVTVDAAPINHTDIPGAVHCLSRQKETNNNSFHCQKLMPGQMNTKFQLLISKFSECMFFLF